MEIKNINNIRDLIFERLANECVTLNYKEYKLIELYEDIIADIIMKVDYGNHIIDLTNSFKYLPLIYAKKLKQMFEIQGFIFIDDWTIDCLRRC